MKSGFVAIVGQPNVGKSTLLNRFIGEELAIVTPKPQTTRQKIIGIYNGKGAQAVFLDTPGFHRSAKMLNKVMNQSVDGAVGEADVAVLVVEPKKYADSMDKEIFEKLKDVKNKIIVVNKIDTIMDEPWGVVVDRYWNAFDKTPTVAISASKGQHIETLLDKIIELLPEGEPFYPVDLYTEHPTRFLAAEIVREQAMLLLKQELPYSLAVEIETFKEPTPENPVTKISAAIVVEKDSQKGIVIGAKGQMIKEIGTNARRKIEQLIGGKVFLELFVKVVKEWTKDMGSMERFGYTK